MAEASGLAASSCGIHLTELPTAVWHTRTLHLRCLAGERAAARHRDDATPEAALWRGLPGDRPCCLCSAPHTGAWLGNRCHADGTTQAFLSMVSRSRASCQPRRMDGARSFASPLQVAVSTMSRSRRQELTAAAAAARPPQLSQMSLTHVMRNNAVKDFFRCGHGTHCDPALGSKQSPCSAVSAPKECAAAGFSLLSIHVFAQRRDGSRAKRREPGLRPVPCAAHPPGQHRRCWLN